MALFRSSRSLAVWGAVLVVALGTALFFRPGQECRAQESQAKEASARKASGVARGETTDGLRVSVLELQPQPLETPVPATGTLLPRESVTIVSELSRRLVRIRAEEGNQVKQGTVLFELDAAELRAEQRRLEVQRMLADRNAERQAQLLEESVTTAAEADAAQTAALEIEASQQLVAATLAKTKILAPFDGVLGLRRVSEGAWVTPSTPLITLSDTSQLKIDFRIPERHASQIELGAEFRIFVEGQRQPHMGRITATEPSIDTTSRSLLVRGLVEGTERLIPGTFAKVELPLQKKNALVVPSIAIIPGVSGHGVYLERDGKAHLIPVELGARTPDKVEVTQGLSVGDRVIVSNLLRLRDGAPVVVENPR